MICEETEEFEKTIDIEEDENTLRGRSISAPMFKFFLKDSATNSPCLSTPRDSGKTFTLYEQED